MNDRNSAGGEHRHGAPLPLKEKLSRTLGILRSKRGEFVVDRSFSVLLGAIGLVLAISIFSVVFQANKLDTVAADLTRQIEIAGQVNYSTINAQLDALCAAAGLENVTLSVDATYVDAGARKIQFGDSFTVTISSTAELGVGGIITVPIPLSSSVVGRSEKYWK